MARPRERLFTIEDWLAYEGEPDRLYELIDGRLVAMNPPKAWHGDIASQLARICLDALQGRFPCRVRSRAGIEISREPRPRGYIADLAVTCEPLDENRPLMAEPRLVVEILSASTGRHDRVSKLADYQQLPSVEEVWLVFSENRLVLQAVCEPGQGWSETRAFIGRARFRSPMLGVEISLDEIYCFTPMAQPTENPGDVDPP
jgi:Uma2 family endonuclease